MHTTLGSADCDNYDQLFDTKAQLTENEFASFQPPELQRFPSPSKHFRMRAEFKVWHEKGTASYAMYKPGEYKQPVIIDSFTIGSEMICGLMPKLLAKINANEEIRRRLFQVEFLSASSGECVITLIYHRPLEAQWKIEAAELEASLSCKIIGRSRGQKVVLSEDFITEEFQINNQGYRYQQVETGFTQPNAVVCQKMLEWAQNVSSHLGGDLLELYCGNGNFTIPLAQNFNQVLATEVSKASVHSAHYNIELNGAKNIDVVRMSSEEFTQAFNGVREFRRLKDINLDDYNFSTVFVDPPRAGLDDETVKLVARFANILYISCNPATLKENLNTLTLTHSIKHFAFFDQFPYTEHRECGVLLCPK